MKFDANAPREYPARPLIPDKSECEFEVMTAEETESKGGKLMMKLKLCVHHEGEQHHIFDHITADTNWKFKQLCLSLGLFASAEAGNIEPHDCVGRFGRLKVGVRPAEGEWQAKNQVKTYLEKLNPDELLPDATPEQKAAVTALAKAATKTVKERSSPIGAGAPTMLDEDWPLN